MTREPAEVLLLTITIPSKWLSVYLLGEWALLTLVDLAWQAGRIGVIRRATETASNKRHWAIDRGDVEGAMRKLGDKLESEVWA